MLTIAKTLLSFDESWLDDLKFKAHDDYDLAGAVDAVSVKSSDGGIHSFYRNKPIEEPQDFKYTKYYSLCKPLIDFFEFETTRVRIHKQDPGKTTPIHTDDNNINAVTKSDYRLRAITALTENEKFVYRFNLNDTIEEVCLKKGQTVIFDPDVIGHGMANLTDDKVRYSLVQVFKAYPLTPWLKDFINLERTINL